MRPRAPSMLNVAIADMARLLGPHINPGTAVLEVGCAPGKILLWCATKGAIVTGVEYAPKSYEVARRLFDKTRTPVDLRYEDFFSTTLSPASFDLVYSFGLIEHFAGDKLREIVTQHARMIRPEGRALIVIPNYRNCLYGSLQAFFDPANIELHNTEIMTREALLALAPSGYEAKAYPWGRISPWLLSPESKWPAPLAMALKISVNAIGLLQPTRIAILAPWLVLEISR